MSTLILACSATKVASGLEIPALDRYDGPLWRVLRRALRERDGLADRLAIYALSARYGLIPARGVGIAYYNQRMTPARAAELAPAVAVALNAGLWPVDYVEVGQAYRLALPMPPWPASIHVGHGSIGKRLQQLRSWLWSV